MTSFGATATSLAPSDEHAIDSQGLTGALVEITTQFWAEAGWKVLRHVIQATTVLVKYRCCMTPLNRKICRIA